MVPTQVFCDFFFVGGIANCDHFVLAGEDQERVLEHKSQQEQISSIPGQDNGNLGRRLAFCLVTCNYIHGGVVKI